MTEYIENKFWSQTESGKQNQELSGGTVMVSSEKPLNLLGNGKYLRISNHLIVDSAPLLQPRSESSFDVKNI